MLVRGLGAQKHRVERTAGHILINERELILRIEIHTVPRAAHEKTRALLRGKVRQQPIPQRRLDVAERCDAHAHQLQLLLVREHRVRLFAVWHDGDVHAVKELRRALDNIHVAERHGVEAAGKHGDAFLSHVVSSPSRR